MPLFDGDPNIPQGRGPIGPGGLQIPYKEVEVREGGSPNESWGYDTSKATRHLMVDWDQRATAVQQILGYPTYKAGNGLLNRYMPECHPEFPWLVASSISQVKGEGTYKVGQGTGNALTLGSPSPHAQQYVQVGGAKIGRYQFAILTVEYEVPDYPVLPDAQITVETQRFTSLKLKPNGDYLTLPVGFGSWENDGTVPADIRNTTVPNTVGKIIPTMDIVFTWYQVPYEALNLVAIFGAIGKVNSTNFAANIGGGSAFPPHTLLLTAVDLKRVRSPYGTWVWNIEYTFKFLPTTHTKLFALNTATRGFYRVSSDGAVYAPGSGATGKWIFDEYDMTNLWKGP